MIRLRAISRTFGPSRRVLRGLDLDVEAGEMVAIIGRSGTGKTTLLNIIGGLDTRYEGSAEVAGQRLETLGDRGLAAFRSRTLAFVFQAYNLLEKLTVAENVSLPRLFERSAGRGSSQRDSRRRVGEILDVVGLAERADDRPGSLSGGERQRVAIARALFARAPLLICDEPTGNLDEATASEVVNVLRRVHAAGEVTVVLATHDRAATGLAGRVLELSDGVLRSAPPTAGGPA